ncbi:unnamed protein product, partial [Diabrotica balteata]
ENVLKLFTEYIVLLNKSTESADSKPAVVPPTPPMVTTPVQSPDMFRNLSPMSSPDKFRNLRNMSVISDPCLADVLSVTQKSGPTFELPEAVVSVFNKKINSFITIARVVLGIDFFFGELPQANIQKCLANGLIIIWTSQGISELTCAAMTEDRYGIVQKDIPALVSTLVDLKQNLDKLSKISALTKKIAGQDDFNYKMKVAVIAAVQRSLFKICLTYKEYLNELPLRAMHDSSEENYSQNIEENVIQAATNSTVNLGGEPQLDSQKDNDGIQESGIPHRRPIRSRKEPKRFGFEI